MTAWAMAADVQQQQKEGGREEALVLTQGRTGSNPQPIQRRLSLDTPSNHGPQ